LDEDSQIFIKWQVNSDGLYWSLVNL